MKSNDRLDGSRELLLIKVNRNEKTTLFESFSKMRKYIRMLRYIFIATIIYLSISFITSKHVLNIFDKNTKSSNSYIFSNEFRNNYNIKCNPIIKDHLPFRMNINNMEYPRSTLLHLDTSINFTCLNSYTKIKKIFFWNAFFDKRNFSYGLGVKKPFEMNNCPVTNCELINDKSRLQESDLVLVHMRDIMDDIPKVRPSTQRWVFVLYESPVHASDYTKFNGVFNLTSTYEIDSDFPGFYESYSNMKWEKNDKFDWNNLDYLKNKKNFAVAIISNCGGTSKRLDFIRELQKYVSVNIFGKCGIPCPSFSSNNPSLTNCKEIVAYEYKFYFAFENSVCKDYITEKLFEILRYPIIPVVLGGGLYDYYIPKSGYINAHDFSTPAELAEHLKYLDNNITAYNSYFEWKKSVKFFDKFVQFSPICDMCIKLHLESYLGIQQKIITDLNERWNKNQKCKASQIHSVKIFNFEKNS